jgi:hypothetical protein
MPKKLPGETRDGRIAPSSFIPQTIASNLGDPSHQSLDASGPVPRGSCTALAAKPLIIRAETQGEFRTFLCAKSTSNLRGKAPFAFPCCMNCPLFSGASFGPIKKVVIPDARTHSHVARWAIRFADVLVVFAYGEAEHQSFDAPVGWRQHKGRLATLWRGRCLSQTGNLPNPRPRGLLTAP